MHDEQWRKGAEWMQKRAMGAIAKACPKAHTYASENADEYRAFDRAAERAIAAVRAIDIPVSEGAPKSMPPIDVRDYLKPG